MLPRLTKNIVVHCQRAGIFKESVPVVIYNKLQMSKVSGRWFPKLLRADERRTCQGTTLPLLKHFFNKSSVMRFGSTFQPDTKQQSKVPGPRAPKKAKSVTSAGKVMASIFWEAKEVLLMDNLEKGHSVTAAHYTDLLRELWEKVKKIWCGKLTGGVLFHQDKAPAHSGNGCHQE